LVINTGKEMRRYGKTPHYFLSAKTANRSSADSSIIQREKCIPGKTNRFLIFGSRASRTNHRDIGILRQEEGRRTLLTEAKALEIGNIT
jgi:hypothetical protein